MMDDSKISDFGPCCACGKEDKTVRNLIMLPKKGSPGKGWGCFVCHLPADGAFAVICDECLEAKREPKFAIDGWATEKKRIPIEQLTEPFDHDDRLHQAEQRRQAARFN